ncbi:MAG: hypothetical protein IIW02_05130 [Clostridia bacterium]|nr:hypothetical protein [Clostridia bacterium]
MPVHFITLNGFSFFCTLDEFAYAMEDEFDSTEMPELEHFSVTLAPEDIDDNHEEVKTELNPNDELFTARQTIAKFVMVIFYNGIKIFKQICGQFPAYMGIIKHDHTRHMT